MGEQTPILWGAAEVVIRQIVELAVDPKNPRLHPPPQVRHIAPISNTGGGTWGWSASDHAAWLVLSPTSGIGASSTSVSFAATQDSANPDAKTLTITNTGGRHIKVERQHRCDLARHGTGTVVARSHDPPPPGRQRFSCR